MCALRILSPTHSRARPVVRNYEYDDAAKRALAELTDSQAEHRLLHLLPSTFQTWQSSPKAALTACTRSREGRLRQGGLGLGQCLVQLQRWSKQEHTSSRRQISKASRAAAATCQQQIPPICQRQSETVEGKHQKARESCARLLESRTVLQSRRSFHCCFARYLSHHRRSRGSKLAYIAIPAGWRGSSKASQNST